MTNSESLAVNRDGYYYSEIVAEDAGEYVATWTVYQKDPVAIKSRSHRPRCD